MSTLKSLSKCSFDNVESCVELRTIKETCYEHGTESYKVLNIDCSIVQIKVLLKQIRISHDRFKFSPILADCHGMAYFFDI